MNSFNAIGNLAKDCRIGNAGDTPVANFTVAVKSGYGKHEQTVWVDCAYFGKGAQAIAQYLVKGAKVGISGELGFKEAEGEYKARITCRVSNVTLLGGKRDDAAPDQPKPDSRSAAAPSADFADDIPF